MLETRGQELDASLPDIQAAPLDGGVLHRIVRRPAVDQRETVAEAELDPTVGLIGDTWLDRGSRMTADGSADPDAQVTLVNIRVLRAFEPDEDRWPLAGDQLYVDLDLRIDSLAPGTRLTIGSAVIEVTDKPHTGCAKYSARFGSEALRWINAPTGRAHRMRGLNARVVVGGTIRVGDTISRV
jgi:MOSC domain